LRCATGFHRMISPTKRRLVQTLLGPQGSRRP
jgi:hypothetical protein